MTIIEHKKGCQYVSTRYRDVDAHIKRGVEIPKWKLDPTCPRCLVKINTGRWPLED